MSHEELKSLIRKTLKDADITTYTRLICLQIRDNIKEIPLPSLTKTEMITLKSNLKEYTPIKSEKIEDKFKNLQNAFLIIQELGTLKDKEKIQPIIEYLKEYKYIFELIDDEKQVRQLEQAIKILNFEINIFNIKYGYLINESNTIDYGRTHEIKTKEEET